MGWTTQIQKQAKRLSLKGNQQKYKQHDLFNLSTNNKCQSCLFLSNKGPQLFKFANSTKDRHNQGGYLSLVLFVPDGDISSSLQQQLTDAWMTHLGCQHQRCPAILEKNPRHTNKYK